jgi:hypothetical protein
MDSGIAAASTLQNELDVTELREFTFLIGPDPASHPAYAHQRETIHRLEAGLRKDHAINGVLRVPTRAGKTRTAFELVARGLDAQRLVLMDTARRPFGRAPDDSIARIINVAMPTADVVVDPSRGALADQERQTPLRQMVCLATADGVMSKTKRSTLAASPLSQRFRWRSRARSRVWIWLAGMRELKAPQYAGAVRLTSVGALACAPGAEWK